MLIEATVCFVLYLFLTALIGVNVTGFLVLLHLVIAPLIFRYSKTFQQQIVFLNYVQWPIHSNFSNPSQRGVQGARNFYIRHVSKVNACKIKIGVWHALPRSEYESCKQQIDNLADSQVDEFFNHQLMKTDKPIYLYCHGNANHRAAYHRVKLYQLLSNMDAHVIAFDYRGYGDSSFVLPTECGVVEDALVVYDWLRRAIDKPGRPSPKVYVWGHSLGSGISSHLLGNLKELSEDILGRSLPHPDGLILESPFSNLRDEVDAHFMTIMVRWLPYFESTFVNPFSGYPHYEFRSDEHLSRVTQLPILILHAEDDIVVAYRLGVKLHKIIASSRSSSDAPVLFHSYPACSRLGHIWICLADDLPDVLTDFMAVSSRSAVSRNGASDKGTECD